MQKLLQKITTSPNVPYAGVMQEEDS